MIATLSGTKTVWGRRAFWLTLAALLLTLAYWSGVQTQTVLAQGGPGYTSNPPPGSVITLSTAVGVPATAIITVSESGGSTLTISGITLSNISAFSLASPANFSIQDGGAPQTISIVCTASTGGAFVTAVVVTHNAPGSPVTYTVDCIVGATSPATAAPTITPTPAAPSTTRVSSEVKGLAVRSGPYLGATLVGVVRPGNAITVQARSTDEGGEYTWYLVSVEGATGWASGRYLQFEGDASLLPLQGSIFDQIDNAPDVGVSARMLAITDLRRRPSGRAQILRQIPPDAIVSVIGRTVQNGGSFWLHVRYEGQVGWIPAYAVVRGNLSNVPVR